MAICFLVIRDLKIDLEEKIAFVRQISHEIRTPLNIANLSLDVLFWDIDNSSEESKEELKFIVDAIKGACDIAMTILNGVLLVEKAMPSY